jgi:hypothetical protein
MKWERRLGRLISPGPKRMLALDGGDIRGALTLGFLEKIEDHVIRTLSPFLAPVVVALTFVLAPISIDTAKAQQSPTEQEAYAIGVDAYLYLYSLVTMDITRKQISNIEPGKGFGGPMNSFVSLPAYPAADLKTVVRPNFDTLYSSGWLDLTKELVIVSVPDTDGPQDYDAVHKIQSGKFARGDPGQNRSDD